MSASTVSITANPAAKRRLVPAGERKSAVSGDDPATPSSCGKDPSHLISAEAILERARAVVKKPPSPVRAPYQ